MPARATLLAAAIAAAATTSALPAAGAPEDPVAECRELVRRGSYGAATERLKPLAERDENARLLLAEIAWRTGAPEEALRLTAGRTGAAALRHAEILFMTGKLGEAAQAADALPSSPEAHLLRGEIRGRRGEIDEARSAFDAAVASYEAMSVEDAEKAPAELFIVFGKALVGLNRFEEANEIMLAQALEKDKESIPVLLFGAEIFASKYDFPEARRYLRMARERDPRNPDVLAALAHVAIEDMSQGGNRLLEARDLVAGALATNPRHERSLILQGDVAFFDGRFNDALASYRKALEANPASLEALGAIYACAHLTFQEAVKREAEEAARKTSKLPAPFYVAASRRSEIQCQYPLALALSARAHQTDPGYWPLFTGLVLGKLRAGRYDEAKDLIAEGLKADEYNVWLENTRRLMRHWEQEYAEERWDNLVFHAPRKTLPFFVSYLGPLLVEAYELFKERYGVAPQGTIHIEVYPSQQFFAVRVLGLPDFPAQGVCFGPVIAVTGLVYHAGNHGLSTWHEFAHVFTVIGSDYRIPRWLTEGVSVREEGLCPVGSTRGHASALGKALARHDLPTFSDFDQRFRRPKDPEQILSAYAISPLAVEYLLERFGAGVLPRLLRAIKEKEFPEAFSQVTGTALAEFDAALQERLRKLGGDLGDQFAGEGVDREALGAKVKAGTATPRDLADLAWGAIVAKNDTDAETAALRLQSRDEASGDASAVLGIVAFRNGRFAKAEELLRRALERKTLNAYRVLEVLLEIAKRRKDAATQERWLVEMWKRFPEFASEGMEQKKDHVVEAGHLGELVGIWEKKGDERLRELLAEIVRLNGQAIGPRIGLAGMLRKAGDREGELKVLRQLAFMIPFEKGYRLNTKLFEQLAACAEALRLPVEAARARKLLDAYKD